eukprot:scaffold17841_cov119-Isochrysis_galbana.AAC.1
MASPAGCRPAGATSARRPIPHCRAWDQCRHRDGGACVVRRASARPRRPHGAAALSSLLILST